MNLLSYGQHLRITKYFARSAQNILGNLGCPITPIIIKSIYNNAIYSVVVLMHTPYIVDGRYWPALFGVAGQPQLHTIK